MPLLIIIGILLVYLIIHIRETGFNSDTLAKIIGVAIIIIPIAIFGFILDASPILALVICVIAAVLAFILLFKNAFKKEKQNSNPPVVDNSIIDSYSDSISEDYMLKTTEETESISDSNIPKEGTSFQDELKHSLATPEELEVAETKRITDIATSDAVYILECVKKELLNQSQKGHYIEIENTKFIECHIRLRFTSFEHPYLERFLHIETTNKKRELEIARSTAIRNCNPKDINRISLNYSKLIAETPEYIYTYSIDKEHEKMYNIFISKLQELANEEGISIFPIIFDSNSGKEIPLPSTSSILGVLAIKCRCRVPDKYSSDIPIYIDKNIIENMESPSGVIVQNNEINIDTMEGHDFEFFCADLLRKNGFKNVSVTQGSGDQGIDIIAFKDDIKYGIQCKCYSSDIGNKAVQEAYSGKTFYNCHIGVVLTNRYFTHSAQELAKNNGIILWDRSKLLSFMEIANKKR